MAILASAARKPAASRVPTMNRITTFLILNIGCWTVYLILISMSVYSYLALSFPPFFFQKNLAVLGSTSCAHKVLRLVVQQ